MTKPLDTRKWGYDDIDDVKQALPEGVEFGTLSGYPSKSLKLDLGTGIAPGELSETVHEVSKELRKIGVPVEETTLTADYFGHSSPVIGLHVKWEGE